MILLLCWSEQAFVVGKVVWLVAWYFDEIRVRIFCFLIPKPAAAAICSPNLLRTESPSQNPSQSSSQSPRQSFKATPCDGVNVKGGMPKSDADDWPLPSPGAYFNSPERM